MFLHAVQLAQQPQVLSPYSYVDERSAGIQADDDHAEEVAEIISKIAQTTADLDASMEDVSTIVRNDSDDVFVFPPLSRDLEVDRQRRRSRPTARTQSSR